MSQNILLVEANSDIRVCKYTISILSCIEFKRLIYFVDNIKIPFGLRNYYDNNTNALISNGITCGILNDLLKF